ncbi:hypothetical protein [Planobispora rosea]|uniref:hypothetical protein n=1 Tax=Planobispora rosea TaxID=35762 RepID=UPI00083B689B|nr:hypothetical protein [Planobispora rosea]
MTACPHGHDADPRMCPTCRRPTTPAEPDPRELTRAALDDALLPYLTDTRQRQHLADHLTDVVLAALAGARLDIVRRPT